MKNDLSKGECAVGRLLGRPAGPARGFAARCAPLGTLSQTPGLAMAPVVWSHVGRILWLACLLPLAPARVAAEVSRALDGTPRAPQFLLSPSGRPALRSARCGRGFHPSPGVTERGGAEDDAGRPEWAPVGRGGPGRARAVLAPQHPREHRQIAHRAASFP
ncbi:Hypothetical predicted protein [Marmota monax]|uniref:Uncharacterized protein n=1 Tax=Marmota monax TaxID=9995 RepID=A0A5E4AMM6_MARMO|nr:hypothetical protein GHT09_019257 [Marmota monax]VTJ58026.1 Hypothetical predicted protein [Marmota monax]